MIIVKYNKIDRARYISHIDTLKHITRIIRRMGVDIEYSQGFNPHMLIKLSAPCPLGISSVAEYMAIECKNIGADEYLRLYNRFALEDLIGLKAWDINKNPNLQGIVQWADYVVPSDEKIDFSDIMGQDSVEISYRSKGKEITKDIRMLIDDIQCRNNSINMRLALGNKTLRPDRLLEYINSHYSINLSVSDIVKTNQYAIIDNKLIGFDKYLDSLV